MSIRSTLDLSGFHQRKAATLQALSAGTAHAVREGLQAGVDYARGRHPHKNRTGYLTSGTALFFRIETIGDKGSTGSLVNIAPYALYVEEGTRAHEIWPKEGHGFVGPLRSGQSRRDITDIGTHRVALRFTIGGRVVFARMVHHPGTPPLPFMYPAGFYAVIVMRNRLELGTVAMIAKIWK